MLSEEKVIELIFGIESKHDPDDDFDYLDEGEQAELRAYYTILDRDLSKEENAKLKKLRKEFLGD